MQQKMNTATAMKGITQMNKSTIDMARESRLDVYGLGKDHLAFVDALQRFAVLVRKDEFEACAKVCDELIAPALYGDADKSMWDVTCMDCAAAIRNRGQA
jgi:hypothetical protein